MEQDTEEHEDHVHDVQAQRKAVGDEVVDDIHQKGQAQDAPQDLGMLQLLSGGVDLVGLILVLHQQGGIDGDGTLPVRVHGVVDEGHGQQHHGAHDDVHGVEDGLGDGGLIGDLTELGAGDQRQGNGSGETGVPDDEAGIGGGDQQGIVHGGDPLGHLLGQQRTGHQAEAPVEPAAHGGDHGGDDDGLHIIVAQTSGLPQHLLTGLGGSHGGTQHQHQSHLHGKGQQTPEAVGIAPCGQHLDGTHAGGEHGCHIDHEGQDDGKQECIRQPAVHNTHASVGESLEHTFSPYILNAARGGTTHTLVVDIILSL